MRHVLALAALVPGLALAAIPTVAINGEVRQPDGLAPASGTIVCTLSQPGSAFDGATSQRVASSGTGSISAGGAVTMNLVPNDAITPVGTAYTCVFSTRLSTGRPATWSETWQLASTPNPVNIGAIPRLSTAPPVAGSYVGTAPSYTATAAIGSPAFTANTGAKYCGDGTGCAATMIYTGSAWSFTPGLTTAPTGASYLTLALDSTLSAERVLQGTASQIVATDGGANGNLTLSLAADVSTTSYSANAASGNNAFAVATNGARLDLGNGATDYVSGDGARWVFPHEPLFNLGLVLPADTSMRWSGRGRLLGSAGSTGTQTAVKVGNSTALTTSGDKIFGFYSDSFTTERSYIDKDGGYAWRSTPTLPTCAEGLEGLSLRQSGGTSSARTKLCLCTSDGAGTPAYAWQNITSFFASEAASVGTTTTCP